MSQVRVHNLAVSLDGFATGDGQSRDAPFGHAGTRLMEWFFPTRTFQRMSGNRERVPVDPHADQDDVFAHRTLHGIGAEIMGAGKFGPPGWQDDPDWRGWWGEEPPFRTPVVVLAHKPRPTLELDGTTFHFVHAPIREALDTARELADGHDIRLGGGPTTIRSFVAADLVDFMHVVVVPIVLGRGVNLWTGLEGFERRFKSASTSTLSGVTHINFHRVPREG